VTVRSSSPISKPKSKTTTKTDTKKRRSPITREEGERRLTDAALRLVRTRPFSEVSVRDIAELADVNHGFVHTWFGSKNDLLARVVQDLLREVSHQAETAPAGEPAIGLFDDRVQLAVRMVIWLNLEGYDFSEKINLVILESLRNRYRDTEGLNPDDAETAAVIASALGIGVGAFAPILQSGLEVDMERVFPMWRHILGLLAKYPNQ
jgi:AcrR family transcriptional regulator